MKNLLYLLFFLLAACENKTSYNSSSQLEPAEQRAYKNEESEEEARYPDDTYSADVEYYNPNTGNSNTYSLEVEVVNNTVTVIHFNNGGWLDETHIVSGGELDEDGNTSIETDKGYIFDITINR